MENTMTENNLVRISGEVISEKEFSHEIFGEGFYLIMVAAARLSGVQDAIPVMVSDRMAEFENISIGTAVSIVGQFRSYNRHNVTPKLILSVFARELSVVDQAKDENEIEMVGFICKKPVLRSTSKENREVCDIMIAVNRAYGKSDYIPCISWGRNAIYSSDLEVGDAVSVKGRIQSRNYRKIVGDSEEVRTAYEVSISRIEQSN